MNNKFIILFFLFILSSAFALAQGLGPGVPHQFYGNATYNGQAADGLIIDVYMEGVKIGSTTTVNSKYGYEPVFLIKDPEGEYGRKAINFYLNGVDTGTTFIFENGASTELDLSASSSPSPSLGGSSGGGGGGGGGGSAAAPKKEIEQPQPAPGPSIPVTESTQPAEEAEEEEPETEAQPEEIEVGFFQKFLNVFKGGMTGVTGGVIAVSSKVTTSVSTKTSSKVIVILLLASIIILAIYRRKLLRKSKRLFEK